MKISNLILAFLFLLSSSVFASSPSLLVLKNQFGEQSNNFLLGSAMPLVTGSSNIVTLTGTGAPTNAVTGANVAAPGSLYIRQSNGDLFVNTNTKVSPTWSQIGTGAGPVLSTALTGFVAGSGTVASSDTVLQGFDKLAGNSLAIKNGTFAPTVEAVIAAGALSTTIMESTVSNVTAGTYAVTLAAPSSQDGQLKIIKAVATMTHTVTLAMTNLSASGVYTPAGTTTLTFTNAGDSVVLMAVGAKWIVLGGSAVAS